MAATSTDKVQKSDLPSVRETHLFESELVQYGQSLLSPEDAAVAREHLDACAECRQRLEELHLDDGTGMTRLRDPLIGRTLGEYKVEDALARGGMGVVYRGVQPMIGKKVAIKVLIPETNDQTTIDRLLEEARAVNAIRHPNIIDIFSFGSLPDGRHYFVMELLDGLSLDELQQQKGKLPADQVITVLEQTMSALGAAHQANVIHRDLKPANLFVSTLPDGSWHVTVLDFGLAKRLGSTNKTSTNLVMGTPGFMAPEQIRGKGAVPQTDLYAMGVVAWVLLTGREPYQAEGILDLMRAHVNEPLPSLALAAPRTPAGLVSLIEQMLAKDPAQRPASAMEVHARLRALRTGLSGPQHKPAVVKADGLRKPGLLVPAGMPSTELADGLEATATPAHQNHTPPVILSPSATNEVLRAVPTKLIKRDSLKDLASDTTRDKPVLPAARADAEPEPELPAAKPFPLVPVLGGLVVMLALSVVAVFWKGSKDPVPTDVVPPPPDEKIEKVEKVEKVEPPRPDVVEKVDPPPDKIEKIEKIEKVEKVEKVEPPPVAKVDPVPKNPDPRPTPKPKGLTAAQVKTRFADAYGQADRLKSDGSRRLMRLELSSLEGRLKDGESPADVAKDLADVVKRYAGR
ncbi:MAG: protein kinase [Myxococcaceae bacterium]